MTRAEDLLAGAAADPEATLASGREYLASLPEDDFGERAVALRAMSLSARFTNQIQMSIQLADEAAKAARGGGLDRLEALAVLTMSGSLAIAGDIQRALGIVRSALEETDDQELRARFRFQEGAVLGNAGRVDEALAAFREVLPAFRSLGDARSMVLVLNQLGRNLTTVGELREAEAALEEALEIAIQSEETAQVPGIEHNLGLLVAHQGDLPRALELLLSSDEKGMAVAGADAPQHVARCEVLMSAGLFEEALDLAKRIAVHNAEREDVEHEANALIVAAQAALMAERYAEAIELSTRADVVLRAADSPSLAREATRVSLEARFVLQGASRGLLVEAMRVAGDLEDAGHRIPAWQARLLAGRIAIQLGDSSKAEELLGPVSVISTGPVEIRLQARFARALLRLDSGDSRGAAAAVSSGLALLERYQQALSATDLRMGIERHGAELGEIGLGLAVDSGRPRRVLGWMERTRARALRYAPVTPSRDDEMREAMGNLRRVDSELRHPGSRESDLLSLRGRLQDQISAIERIRSADLSSSPQPTTDQLIDSLGEATLVELAVVRGQLVAVVVAKARARLVELGAAQSLFEELRHARFAMRRSARMRRDFDSRTLDRIDEGTLSRLSLSTQELVLVPPPALMAVPWAALPAVRGVSVAVSPSADLWWRARRSPREATQTVIAGGPDLKHAKAEVEAIGGLYQSALTLTPGAGVEEIREAVAGADVAHIACHASFNSQNPMFSSLRLGDGDLNVYDIERLTRPPKTVVLSACDSGYTDARAGEELAGLTSALLSMGTQTVVASIGLVPDTPATSDLMVDFHRGLVSGLEPAAALSKAQAAAFDDPDRFLAAASFLCIGA